MQEEKDYTPEDDRDTEEEKQELFEESEDPLFKVEEANNSDDKKKKKSKVKVNRPQENVWKNSYSSLHNTSLQIIKN